MYPLVAYLRVVSSFRGATVSFNFFLTIAMSANVQLAAAAYIFIHEHQVSKRKKKSRRWRLSKLYASREMCNGTTMLADLKFQHVSGLYKNFTRMHPTDFEFLLFAIEFKIAK